jgi:hypothetical protein
MSERFDYQQQQLEQERLEQTLAILARVANGNTTQADAEFLARELCVSEFFTSTQLYLTRT